jgi:hypothetical protein
VLAGEEAARKRVVRADAKPLGRAQWEHLVLDVAGQDVVRRLKALEPFQIPDVTRPQRF